MEARPVAADVDSRGGPHWNLWAMLKLPENLASKGPKLELSPMLSLGVAYSFH